MIPQSLNAVQQVDMAFYIIFGVSIAMLFGITVVMLWFVYRYHHTRHPDAQDISGNALAETVWIVIPSLIVMGLFYYGWVGYKALRTVPDNAMEVKVTARMWSWVFEYENGRRSSVLYVPQGTPVKLDMTSVDVIHSLYVPAYRIKMDTVPGMHTYAWFNPDTSGSFDVFCAEYCGLKHANMITTVEVLPPDDFSHWYTNPVDTAGGGKALALFETYGCLSCHSMDGTPGVGPSFKDLYGTVHTVPTADGSTREMVVDEPYLRRAILDPEANPVPGYAPVMMSYEGIVSDADLDTMIGWFLHGNQVSVDAGRELMMTEGCLSCHSTDGSEVVGPTLKDLWGRSVTVIVNGESRTVTANNAYLEEAIVHPGASVVEGYADTMPPYPDLTREQMDQMLEYMRALSSHAEGMPSEKGAGASPDAHLTSPAQPETTGNGGGSAP